MIPGLIAKHKFLIIAHVLLITMSNVLVQYPFEIFGYHTTWGAFTYPFIFILTDLTIRLSGAMTARNTIFFSMIPGLLVSYGIASYLESVGSFSWKSLFTIHPVPLRIALACFTAYVIGQLMDIFIFQRVRNNNSWWLAPACSTTAGNIIDTLLFFILAFYHSTNPFLSQHWPEIAMIDICFKIIISLLAFVPLYGIVVRWFDIKYPFKHAS